MGDETARLVVQVSNQGINETTSSLAGLANQSRATEQGMAELIKQVQLLNLSTKENYIGLYDLNKTMLGLGTTTRQQTQTNKEADQSFGSLALKIAGYSSALNLGISIARSAVTGMKDLAVEAVTLAGSFERSRVAWGVFMKDVSAGSQMFDELYSLAQRTPLTFQGVERAAQMLKGFGLASSEIIPTLERMGDVARGNDETMQRLALAYGQALAQGRVLTRDLYQFVNAGVPIFDALSQVMGKSVEQVQALVTDGKVGFPEIEKALKALTEEGGQFNGMMEKTAETFEGKLSIAADNWRAILANTAESTLPLLKTALDAYNAGADDAISKANLLKVISGQGGNAGAAIAYVDRKITATQPNGWMDSDPTLSGWNGTSLSEWQAYKDQIQQTLAAQGEAARHGVGAGLYAPPTITPTETKWRNLLQEQGIQSWQKDWIKNENGTYIPAEKLPSGADLIQRQLNNNAIGFENVVGSKYEDDFRKKFTTKAEALQEAMLASGLWKIGEYSVSLIDAAIAKFGYTKPTKSGKGETGWSLDEEALRIQNTFPTIFSIPDPENSPFIDEEQNRVLNTYRTIFSLPDPENAPWIDEEAQRVLGTYRSIFSLPDPANAPWIDEEAERVKNTYRTIFSLPTPFNAPYLDEEAARISGTYRSIYSLPTPNNAPYLDEEAARISNTYKTIFSLATPENAPWLDEEALRLQNTFKSIFALALPENAPYLDEESERVKNTFRTIFSLPDPDNAPFVDEEQMRVLGTYRTIFSLSDPENASWIDEEKQRVLNTYRTIFALPTPYNAPYLDEEAIRLTNTYAGVNALSMPANAPTLDEETLRSANPNPSRFNYATMLEQNRRTFEGGTYLNPLSGDIAGYTVPTIDFGTAVTDEEKYAQAVAKLNDEAGLSIDGYNQRLRELAEQYDPATKAAKIFSDAILSTTVNTLSSELFTLGEALVSGADGWTSFGDAMGNTLEAIIKMLPKLAIQAGLGMLTNTNPADDTLGLALIGGGLVGQIGAGMLGNANGGVYSSPSLSRYSNGVYDRPQMFAFARGGVFAEAGPEAIMPLSRDSAGRLGVKAQGGGEIAVQIINNTSVQIAGKAQTVTDASGAKKLIVTMREIARQEVATANAGGRRLS